MLAPRIGKELDEAIARKVLYESIQRLGYHRPRDDQVSAVMLTLRGLDLFVSNPTGSRKSFCYACLPYIYGCLYRDIDVYAICCNLDGRLAYAPP